MIIIVNSLLLVSCNDCAFGALCLCYSPLPLCLVRTARMPQLWKLSHHSNTMMSSLLWCHFRYGCFVVCLLLLNDSIDYRLVIFDAIVYAACYRKQVIAQQDDMPPADHGGYTSVRRLIHTALVAWPRHCAPSRPWRYVPSWPRWDRQTDGSRHRLMPPPNGGGIISHCLCHTASWILKYEKLFIF